MNTIKKYSGIIWMLLAPAAIFFLIKLVVDLLAKQKPGPDYNNTLLQWGIMIIIFVPICIGLMIFGWYALKGEYKDDV